MGTRSNLGAAEEKKMMSGCKTLTQKEKKMILMNLWYLNKVRFSSLKSREQRVMQSWSNTKGWGGEKKKHKNAHKDHSINL